MFVFILVFLLIAALHTYLSIVYNHWNRKRVYHISPSPIVGSHEIVFFKKSIGAYLETLYKSSTEAIIGFYILLKPCVLIKDLSAIKRILVKDFQYFADKTLGRNETHDPIGSKILFVIPNPEWKYLRSKMTPAFSSGKIKSTCPLIAKVGADLVDYLKRNEGVGLDARELSAKYSTDVITSCAFGIDGNCFVDENSQFRRASRKIFEFSWSRGVQFSCHFFAPILLKPFRMKFLDPFASELLRETFWQRVSYRKKHQVIRNDLIDTIIELCSKENDCRFQLGDDIIVAQAAQFFIAGFDTIASAISFTLYELALNKDIQIRLSNEISDALEGNAAITYDVLQKLDYLDMVLNETLRKYPPLPFLDRKAGRSYRIPDTNITLDEGTSVYISILGIHYDPEYYPEPEIYDPDRFSPENKAARPSFTFLPFGEGPRNCIGARFGVVSAKLGLIHILTNFEVLTTPSTPLKIELDPRGFLLSPKQDIILAFKNIC